MSKKTLFITIGIVIVIIAIFIWKNNNTLPELVLVKKGNLIQEVSASGRAEAVQSVELAFEKGGEIANKCQWDRLFLP